MFNRQTEQGWREFLNSLTKCSRSYNGFRFRILSHPSDNIFLMAAESQPAKNPSTCDVWTVGSTSERQNDRYENIQRGKG